jgi:hypothetical protein
MPVVACAGLASAQAQVFEVGVGFVQTRGWERVVDSRADMTGLADRRDVVVLSRSRVITENRRAALIRLDSTQLAGNRVGATVTPTVSRGGIRLEGHAAVNVDTEPASRRVGSKRAVDTVASAFNRTVAPGETVTIHLGRRWVTVRESWWRSPRGEVRNVPIDYYVILAAVPTSRGR